MKLEKPLQLNQDLTRRALANVLYGNLGYICNMVIKTAFMGNHLAYCSVEESVLVAISERVQEIYKDPDLSKRWYAYDETKIIVGIAQRESQRLQYHVEKEKTAFKIITGQSHSTRGFTRDMQTFTYPEKFLRYMRDKQQGTIASLMNDGCSFQEIANHLGTTLVHVYVQHKWLKRAYRLWTYLHAKYEENLYLFKKPGVQKKVMELFLEGCGKAEIAELMNMQVNNVRQHLWQIREKLRRAGVDIARLKENAYKESDEEFKKVLETDQGSILAK